MLVSVVVFWAGLVGAQGVQTASITLGWEPSTGDEVFSYKIYYGGEPFTYTNAVVFGDVAEATIDGLSPGATYYFAATAVAGDGAESDFSNEVIYTVPGAEDPYEVTIHSLELSDLGETGTVTVGWTPARGDSGGYFVFLGLEPGVYTDIRWIDSPPTEHPFQGLARGYAYYFAVSALSPDGTEGPLSPERRIYVPLPDLPPIDAELDLLTGGSGAAPPKVLISWDDVQAPGYVVHYGTASGEYFASAQAEPGVFEMTIEALIPGRTYFFVVKPVFRGGAEGLGSEELSCAIPLVSGPRAALRRDAQGDLMLTAQAPPGTSFEVLTSTGFDGWVNVGIAIADDSGGVVYEISADRTEPQRFFMLRWSGE